MSQPQKKPNILIVDDEELVLELIKHMLRDVEHGEVALLPSCQKAYQRLTKHPDHFDLIISDWDVPGLNGLEFLKKVRKLGSSIPFMMVTGNSSKQLVVRAIEEGIDDYIVKPFTAKTLLDKVSQLTDAQLLTNYEYA